MKQLGLHLHYCKALSFRAWPWVTRSGATKPRFRWLLTLSSPFRLEAPQQRYRNRSAATIRRAPSPQTRADDQHMVIWIPGMHMHNVTVLLCSQHAHAFPHSNRPTRFYHADMHVHVLKSCQILKHAHACTIRGHLPC